MDLEIFAFSRSARKNENRLNAILTSPAAYPRAKLVFGPCAAFLRFRPYDGQSRRGLGGFRANRRAEESQRIRNSVLL